MEKEADSILDESEDLLNYLVQSFAENVPSLVDSDSDVKMEEVIHTIPSAVRTKETDGQIEILDSSDDEMDIEKKSGTYTYLSISF
jgi:hypothetical protein